MYSSLEDINFIEVMGKLLHLFPDLTKVRASSKILDTREANVAMIFFFFLFINYIAGVCGYKCSQYRQVDHS